MSKLPKVNSSFTPILLKGHERSITTVKYNLDGDLIFTAAKDNNPTVWYADDGIRLGTYGATKDGKSVHKGAVWDIDPSWDSSYVITACADEKARLFECTTGRFVAQMPHKGAVRACKWGDGPNVFATASDPFHTRDLGCINIFEMPTQPPFPDTNEDAPIHEPKLVLKVDDNDRATCLGWTVGDEYVIAGFDSGLICKYDADTGKEVARAKIHNDRVNRINFNREKSMFITASRDNHAKLVDPETLTVIKDFKTDRPVNGAAICPTHPHIFLGGGQDAQNVTTTSAAHGKFESRMYHMVYGEEFGRVRGHFGPINALDIHPFGKSFASGSEDGFIRLHHFDANYTHMPSYLPASCQL